MYIKAIIKPLNAYEWTKYAIIIFKKVYGIIVYLFTENTWRVAINASLLTLPQILNWTLI